MSTFQTQNSTDLTFELYNDDELLNTQKFKVSSESLNLNVEDTIAAYNHLYQITHLHENEDGTVTATLDQNLRLTVDDNKQLEKMTFHYKPQMMVNSEGFKDLKLVNIYHDNIFAEEEWELNANGNYCTTRIQLDRSSVHEDVSIHGIKQIFQYSHL